MNKFIIIIFINVQFKSVLASNGYKLYEEFMKYQGQDDAFNQVFGLRPLNELTDPILRDNQFGFHPGLWGSELLPINFWFFNISIYRLGYKFLDNRASQEKLSQFQRKSQSWILDKKFLTLINMNWLKLTTICNELTTPRCSWKYFINIADPFGMDFSLLAAINPFINSTIIEDNKSERDELYARNYFVPVTLLDCYPIKSIEQLSVIYIYAVCFMYSEHLETDSMRICPNPCKNFPCRSIRNADVNSCKHFGVYQRDFKCSCLQGFRWDSKSLACLAENYCFTVCDDRGTMTCYFSIILGTVECVCKKGFMGYNCAVLENACIFSNNHPSYISGLEACNVPEGKNKCVPLLGTSSYSCRCTSPFVADRNLPYDNCLATMELCAERLCVFGSCETAPDGYRSYCQCDLNFKGQDCDVPRGQWSAWSNWTICFPDCGVESNSRRLRYCVGQIDDCIGQPEEVSECTKKVCFYNRAPEQMTYDVFWKGWMFITLISGGYLLFIVVLSSILTLCRSQTSRVERETAKKERKKKIGNMIKRLKRKYGWAPNAANVIETLEDVWNPNANDEELNKNLRVIYQILIKLRKKHPDVFKKVLEKSEIAALALNAND